MYETPPVDVENAVSAHLIRESQRMEDELLQARAVQRYLLPAEVQEHPPAAPRCRTAYAYHPLHHVGGDFLDTYLRADGNLVLMVGDVSGHGMAAALSSAMLKTAFLRHAATATGPGNLLTLIDGELRDTVRFGRFVTAMVAWFDTQTCTLTIGSAGHPLPILARGNNIAPVTVESDLPLFTGESVSYPDTLPQQLLPGDRLLLLTDGVLESLRSNGELLATEGLIHAMRDCPHTSNFAQCVFESLLFSDLVFNDDVSLLALEVL